MGGSQFSLSPERMLNLAENHPNKGKLIWKFLVKCVNHFSGTISMALSAIKK